MFGHCLRNLEPTKRIRTLNWCIDNIFTHPRHNARPYDHMAYPHLGAPGGPMDAFDDPKVRNIWLMFASRLGKTFFGQCCQLSTAAEKPCEMMFASSTQQVAVDVVARTYGMLQNCRPLRPQMRPENRRKEDRIDLDNCRVWVGWSRSVSTLADKDVAVGHGNEIDKWEHLSTSKEADPLKLFADRGKNIPTRKFIYESTPSIKGRSRVERGLIQSDNRRLHVSCPHCRKYQFLEFGTKDTAWGIKWEKHDGKSDKDLARRTARYVCRHCEGRIEDHHRAPLMRSGVWVPEGCSVDDERARLAAKNAHRPDAEKVEYLTGSPARSGVDAGYQLSSLYALSLSWGDIAAEFVACKDKPQELRNFINQWLGETWEIIAQKQTWQQLGERIASEVPRGMVPEWATIITAGIDRQQDHFVWVVDAWGPERRSHTVAYGDALDLTDIFLSVIQPTYNHADRGEPLRMAFGLVDSGYRPEGVYEWSAQCIRDGFQVFPCKGSSTALNADYRVATLGENTSMPGMTLVHVDTIRTQGWIDRQLHVLKQPDAGCHSVHKGSLGDHQDYLEQLLNDAAVLGIDTRTKNDRENWERIDVDIPNDFRDCRRYSYAAMLVATRGAPIQPRTAKPEKRSALLAGGGGRPDGRSWIPER